MPKPRKPHAADCPHCARIIATTGALIPTDDALADIERIMREGTRVTLTGLTRAEKLALLMGDDHPKARP